MIRTLLFIPIMPFKDLKYTPGATKMQEYTLHKFMESVSIGNVHKWTVRCKSYAHYQHFIEKSDDYGLIFVDKSTKLSTLSTISNSFCA